MRPTHKNRNRNRHRSGGGGSGGSGGGGGGGGNPLSRVYESNGPDVKVRGTAQTVADKYLQLGRDAQSAGDIVMAESYFQYAEHYLRIVSAAQAYNQQNNPQQIQQQYRRPEDDFDDEDLEDPSEASVEPRGQGQQGGEPDGLGDQPSMEGSDRPPQNQQFRQPRNDRDFNRDNNNQNRDNNNQNRDNNNQNRDNNNQNRDNNSQNRDRFRPRWQDRRNNEGQQVQAGEPRQQNQQPRQDEQPRNEPVAAPAAEESDRWEAPSFLRRPAPAPAPVEAVAEEVAAAPVKRRRTRKDAAAEAPEGSDV
ncbi:DUF4167 domain-containing protein [Aestuariivirga sp.]|uniref:DUF4167 domain-containing protein n=1 Tax=Aestuariivirga sp. TaxID=2650926 RepID=UPI0030168618